MTEPVNAVVKAIRTALAAEIRDRAADIRAQAEVIADVPTGAGDDHPFMLGMEFAAQIVDDGTGRPEPLNDIEATGKCCCNGCIGEGRCDLDVSLAAEDESFWDEDEDVRR